MQKSKTIPPPPLDPRSPGRPDKPRYRQQFGLIIVFADEAAQMAGFETLIKAGFKPRVVVT